jgi:membrane protein
MSEEEKKDGKLKAWIKAKVDKAKAWYNRGDNYLRKVHFPGTNLSFMRVLINFFKSFVNGRTIDRAAGVAFNFFVALFPLILFFFTLIPYIPIPHLYDRLMLALDSFLIPSGTMDYVKETIDGIMNQPHDGLLSISIVMCLVFGSSGVVAVFNGFRNVYADYLSPKKLGLKGWIVQRLFAILMLIIIGVLLVVSVLLISLGGTALRHLVDDEILVSGSFTYLLFEVLRWVIGVFALCLGIALLYYFGNERFDEQYRVERKKTGPNGEKLYRNFVVFSPGTILAATLFILGTVAFNTYISNFSRYNVLYGSIGTLIILLLWIWIVAILILAGNDLNSGIRRDTDRKSNAEDEVRRREIVIEDLKKHIKTYQDANEFRAGKIEELMKTIEETEVMVQSYEEQNRDYELIIQEYEKFAEYERKRSDEQYDKEFVLKEELEKLRNPS